MTEESYLEALALRGEDALEHYGVKGMKWGIRKKDDTSDRESSTEKAAPSTPTGRKELARLDSVAAAHPDRILEQAGVERSPNYERNRKLLIAGGVGLGIAAVAAGAYYYNQKSGGTASLFEAQFQNGLKTQLTKKLPPLDMLDDNDLTLPKSTIFQRVAGSANETFPSTHLYVSHLEEDANRYVGVFSSVVEGRAGEAHLTKLSMNSSVSSPSLKKRVEIMKNMLGEIDRDPKSLTEGMSFREVLIESTAAARAKVLGGSESGYEASLSRLSDNDLVRETYGTFVNTMGGQINNPQYRVSHAASYLDKVRGMGYNALVDDANVGVLAKSPIMLLNPAESIAQRTSTRITAADVKAARDKIQMLKPEDALIRHSGATEGGLRMSQEDELFEALESLGETVLAHYGVKGMKWGVRNDDSGGRGRTKRAITKAAVALNASAKVADDGEKKLIFLPQEKRNSAALKTHARVLAEAAVINRSPQFKGKDLAADPKLQRAYYKKVEAVARKTYEEELGIARTEAWADFLGVESSAITRQMRIDAAVDRIKHADSSNRETLLVLNFKTNELGHIVGVTIGTDYAQHFETAAEAIAHYGVKGMKWGVRKDDRGSGNAAGGSEYAPLAVVVGVYAAIFGAAAIYSHVDSGKPNQKRTMDVPWKQKPELTGKKSVKDLESDVVKQINSDYPAKGTKMNCRRCTFAYEMRRRGLDVKATTSVMATGQDTRGLGAAIKNQKPFESIWGEKQISTPRTLLNNTPQQAADSVFAALGTHPNGARGELGVGWAFGGGHSMAWEVVNNKPVIFDTQNSKTYTSSKDFAEFAEYMTDAAHTRLDNVSLDEGFLRRWAKNVD